MLISSEQKMDKVPLVPNTLAARTLKNASTYLGITIAMLLGSVGFEIVFVDDLLRGHPIGLETDWPALFLALLFGLVLLGGSTYSLLRAWRSYSLVSKLELDGQTIEGIITNRWVDIFEGKSFYCVSYRFREDLEIWETITEELFKKLRKGSNVPVRFLRYNPKVSRLDHERISIS